MAEGLPANMTEQERKAMGGQLSAAAYAESPIVPEGLALSVIVIAGITMGLATIVVALRTYVRFPWTPGRSSKGWGWDDTFALLSYVSNLQPSTHFHPHFAPPRAPHRVVADGLPQGAFLSSGVFAIKAAHYGLGTPDSKLNNLLMIRCAEYMLYSQVLYGLSMPLVKATVVFMLLHFTKQRKYRWTLYIMQFAATVMAIIGILASLLYCKPVQAYWNPLLGKCGDFMVVVRIGYAWTAVGIVTDWCAAILPWFVVRKLQLSPRSKITVMGILGLGAVASTATIVRTPYLKYYLVQTDRLCQYLHTLKIAFGLTHADWNGHITIWSLLESGIGIIASSLPALRSLFMKYLENTRYGSGNKSSAANRSGSKQLQAIGGSAHKPSIPLDTLTSGRASGQWNRLEDDASSKGIIVQEKTFNIEYESLSDGEPRDEV